jgi:hypothetical protein
MQSRIFPGTGTRPLTGSAGLRLQALLRRPVSAAGGCASSLGRTSVGSGGGGVASSDESSPVPMMAPLPTAMERSSAVVPVPMVEDC